MKITRDLRTGVIWHALGHWRQHEQDSSDSECVKDDLFGNVVDYSEVVYS